jgi:hypothetical protein
MSQITLYIPEAHIEALKRKAKKEKQSLSAYVTKLVQADLAPPTWPAEFRATFGSVVLAREPEGKLEPRDKLR